MIHLQNVTLKSRTSGVERTILKGASVSIPCDRRIALIAPTAEERASFLHLLAGVVPPIDGLVVREKRVSFPSDLMAAYDLTISLRNNLKYVARIYGVNPKHFISFFQRMAGLGEDLDKLLIDFPKEIRRQIAQIVPLSLPFDVYVSNGLFRGGPSGLVELAEGLLEVRSRQNGMILSQTKRAVAVKTAELAIVVRHGDVCVVENVEHAFDMLQ